MSKTITAIKRGFKSAREAMKAHQSRIPKYQNVWCTLMGLAFGLMWLSDHVDWIPTLSLLALAAGLSVYIAGCVAERREWDAKHAASLASR
jgi:hypothetical protein